MSKAKSKNEPRVGWCPPEYLLPSLKELERIEAEDMASQTQGELFDRTAGGITKPKCQKIGFSANQASPAAASGVARFGEPLVLGRPARENVGSAGMPRCQIRVSPGVTSKRGGEAGEGRGQG